MRLMRASDGDGDAKAAARNEITLPSTSNGLQAIPLDFVARCMDYRLQSRNL